MNLLQIAFSDLQLLTTVLSVVLEFRSLVCCVKVISVAFPQDLEDRDDERPQVVQLSKNDMTAEEAKKHWEQEKTSGKASGDSEGKSCCLSSCSTPTNSFSTDRSFFIDLTYLEQALQLYFF